MKEAVIWIKAFAMFDRGHLSEHLNVMKILLVF